QFWDFAHSHGIAPHTFVSKREKDRSIIVACPPDPPDLPAALQMLEEFGWKAHRGHVPDGMGRTHFTLRIAQIWEESDLDQASFLSTHYWGGNDGLRVWFGGFDGDRLIGVAKSVATSIDYGET